MVGPVKAHLMITLEQSRSHKRDERPAEDTTTRTGEQEELCVTNKKWPKLSVQVCEYLSAFVCLCE